MGEMNNIKPIMSNLVQLFEEAVGKEEIHEIKRLLSEIMKISENHVAAEEIGQLWLELASIKNQHGHTAMHIVSESGDAKMVQFLGKLNPQSRPESLEKLTSNQDTVLLNSEIEASDQVLLDETKIHNQDHIQSHTAALEVCKAISDDRVLHEIGLILQEAAARQKTAFPVQQSSELPAGTANGCRNNPIPWPIETRNVLLMIVGMIATLFFTVAINLPAQFSKEYHLADKSLSGKAVIAGRDLPAVVYLMIVNSTGFLTTMAAIIVLVWPLQFRTIMILLVMCTCIVYVILVNKIVPKFSLRVGKFSISSIALVWSLVLALIFSGISILSLRKYTWSICQYIYWLWTKRTICRSNTLGDLNA